VATVAQRKAVLLKADVAQAFPSARPRRLAHRLEELGLGAKVALFAERFATGRSATLRVDGRPRPQLGLPQGSPVSPVLLALFYSTAPRANGIYNYVDDFGILGTGRDHAAAKADAQGKYARPRSLGHRAGCPPRPG